MVDPIHRESSLGNAIAERDDVKAGRIQNAPGNATSCTG